MKQLIFVMTLLASGVLCAQTPFDGTWMTKLDTAKFPTKPDKYSLSNNMYECLTCVPKVSVKADGTDQKVTGHPYFDTIAVKVVNASAVEIIQKKDGKVMYTDTATVSSDGNTLDDTFTDTSGTQPVTGEATSKRVAPAPAGAHALSGSWRTEKVNSVSDNGLTITYQGTENGLKMSDQNGNSYDAKFDGKKYAWSNDPASTMSIFKKLSDTQIEELDYHKDKLTDDTIFTAAADGKSIAVVDTEPVHETKTSYTMDKQP